MLVRPDFRYVQRVEPKGKIRKIVFVSIVGTLLWLGYTGVNRLRDAPENFGRSFITCSPIQAN
tara:strand:+ start:3011 stop:3199 length:189 start_codon:yes stop_codon:yes gene_type:complete